jgi:hypothetical protein
MLDNESARSHHPVGERRKHRRHFIDLPADCFVIQNKRKGPVHVGIAENAGAGGLSVYLDEKVSSGKQLIIEMYYKDDCRFSSLKVLGQVVWTSNEKETLGYKHGLKLLKLETGGSPKLKTILKHCPILI